MRYLIINCAFFFLITSCQPQFLKNVTNSKLKQTTFKNLYFSNTKKDYVFKAKISAFKHFFGGLLIIKKINAKQHRIVFTTDFGNTIFDFEITNNKLITRFILPQLNRTLIIKTLEYDFKALISETNYVSAVFKDEKNYIFKSKTSNRYNYYIVDKQTHLLKQIRQVSKYKEKTQIQFNSIKDNSLKNITIEHKNLDLNISLATLTN